MVVLAGELKATWTKENACWVNLVECPKWRFAVALVLACVLISAGFISVATAAPSKAWEYADYGTGTCIVETADGGYMVAGGHGSQFLLVKVNATGGFEWNQTCGGPNGNWAMANCLIPTRDGGFALAGTGENFNFAKIDNTGNVQWKRLYSESGAGAFWVTSILQTADGGYMLAGANDGGYSQGNHSSSTVKDWVVRISQNGTMMWSKTYNITESPPVEVTIGRAVDGGYLVSGKLGAVRIDDEGNVVWSKQGIQGQFTNTIDGGYLFAASSSNIGYLTKIDSEGNVEWKKTYAEINGEKGVTFSGIAQTFDGEYVVGGQCSWYDPGASLPKVFACAHVTKVSEQGAVEWSVLYYAIGPPMPSQQNFVSAVIPVSEWGYVFVGIRRTYLWIGKINEPLSARPSLKPSPTVTQTSTPDVIVTPTISSSPTLVASLSPSPSSTMPALPSPSLPRADTSDSVLPVEWVYAVGVGLAAIAVAVVACARWRIQKNVVSLRLFSVKNRLFFSES
jgi:hypothetical protein